MSNVKSHLKYDDYIKGIKKLKPEEQLNLLEIISMQLKKNLKKKNKKHSIMELAGLGKELWKGVDAQRYVNEERKSWD